MPQHACIDPHAPYARREVRVEFERIGPGLRLIAAVDDRDDDILIDVQRADLLREIADTLAAGTLTIGTLAIGTLAADIIRNPSARGGARASAPC